MSPTKFYSHKDIEEVKYCTLHGSKQNPRGPLYDLSIMY